jgi:hypothetical protein
MHDGYDGFHLACGLRPFWSELYRETSQFKRIRGVCVDVLALLRKMPAPPTFERVCVQRSVCFTVQDGGALSFLRAQAHVLPKRVGELISYVAGG